METEIKKKDLWRERNQLAQFSLELMGKVESGELSSKEAIDQFFAQAKKSTSGRKEAMADALITATGAALYIRPPDPLDKAGKRSVGNRMAGNALGADALHHFFASAYNGYRGVPEVAGSMLNLFENDPHDANANMLGLEFGKLLRGKQDVSPSAVIVNPPPPRPRGSDRF